MSEAEILFVDDDRAILELVREYLAEVGYRVEVVDNGVKALEIIKDTAFEIVFTDIKMPDIDGLELLSAIKEYRPETEVIIVTGHGSMESAIKAMKYGSYDYLQKPFKLNILKVIIDRIVEEKKLKREKIVLKTRVKDRHRYEGLVGISVRMQEIYEVIDRMKTGSPNVLIEGESGTGKELVANTVWHFSARKETPFVALNCASLSENLIESEIFGHEKGAFTNAYQLKHGLVEVADKGTLFLDEIGEMPVGLQAKLLRFLDSGEFRRVGGNKAMSVDVRLIAATNKDLPAIIKKGMFREDLYYRLNVINIAIPPLRERKEDLPELSQHFLAKYAKKLSKTITGISSDALELLAGYDWPGNVRELENIIERAVILCETETLGAEDLSIPSKVIVAELGTNPSLEEMEKNYILRVLKEVNGNQSKASQLLGIDRKTLYLKLKKYGISS
jgi:DNA-binding NtrC family response regulator